MSKNRTDFCTNCRKNTKYRFVNEEVSVSVGKKAHKYKIKKAICEECGQDMNLSESLDEMVRSINDQYRVKEGLASNKEINNLMSLYNIGKAPLSFALGFGEVTIARYLNGFIPSKKYSAIIHKALESPEYMKKLLIKNRKKVGETAYKKSMKAIHELKNISEMSQDMINIISYIFFKTKEITPLSLQKILYFIQGISLAIRNKPCFSEDCEAWAHGPVFPAVYFVFKDFKFSPIDDARFAIFKTKKDKLNEEQQEVCDLVLNSFGLYSGKILEQITHKEKPWKEAREDLFDDENSNEIIKKISIKKYFVEVNNRFNIASEEGLLEYIDEMR